MSELIPITVAAIVLALLSHNASEYDRLHCRYGRQDRLWFGIMAVLMILFVGLRTQYNDTDNYEWIYENMDYTAAINWTLGENPLFVLTNQILHRLDFFTQSFLLFYSAITVWLNLWFLKNLEGLESLTALTMAGKYPLYNVVILHLYRLK